MTLVFFFSTILLEIICLPFYVDFRFNKLPYTIQKMICSTLFLLAGIFSLLYSHSSLKYSAFILAALILSWGGDLALAKLSKGLRFVAGLVMFLFAHICYILAFNNLEAILFDAEFVHCYEAVAVFVMLLILILISKKLKFEFGSLKIPVMLYAIVICTMFVMALSTGIRAIRYHVPDMYAIFVLLTLSALLFLISDSVLVFIIFKNKRSQLVEAANIIPYYIAQFLFAGIILIVNSCF